MTKPEDGYTLIELIVVMAIMALISATALPYLGFQKQRDVLSTASDTVMSALQDAQSRAVSRNRPSVVQFDALTRTITVDGKAVPQSLPDQVTVKAVAIRQGATNTTARYVFLPTGESSGGAITLTFGGDSRRIEINWLTGAIQSLKGPAT
jgi:type II secretion system protein H